MKKVIVIGAGTIGLHSAYYLTQKGFQVEVLESRDKTDSTGCSYGNCGFVVPSHFSSMASPSMLKAGIQMMFQSKGPVAFHPFKNIKNAKWFLQFMMASNHKRNKAAAPLLFELNFESNKLYKELLETHGWKNEYTQDGLLMISTTSKGMEEEIELAHQGKELGILTEILDADGVRKIEPDVEFNIEGAVKYYSDGHLNPAAHLTALKKWLEENGVVFRYNRKVTDFKMKAGKIETVLCGEEAFEAEEVVLATGALSSGLAKKLGFNVPVLAGKGYSIDFDKATLPIRHPAILVEDRVALTPLENMVRLGSGMEFNGQLNHPSLKRVQSILDATSTSIPTFTKQNVEELDIWEGQRPLSPDGVPFIGRTGRVMNVLIAAGHAMMGMSLGPITGKLIAQTIAGEKPSISSPLLSPDRY